MAGKFPLRQSGWPGILLRFRRKAGNRIVKRQRVHVYYLGRVQGVGFRYTARQTAAGYEVTGIVRNLRDGRVELVAEGVREELEAFLEGIRDSGLGGMVTDRQTSWSAATGEFRGFEIVS